MNSLPWLACNSSQSPAATFNSRASPTSKEAAALAGMKSTSVPSGRRTRRPFSTTADDFHRFAPVKVVWFCGRSAGAGRVRTGWRFSFALPSTRANQKRMTRFLLLADDALSFQRLAHLVRDRLNLRPSGRDQQRRPALFGGRQVRIGGTLVKLAVIRRRFRDRAKFERAWQTLCRSVWRQPVRPPAGTRRVSGGGWSSVR